MHLFQRKHWIAPYALLACSVFARAGADEQGVGAAALAATTAAAIAKPVVASGAAIQEATRSLTSDALDEVQATLLQTAARVGGEWFAALVDKAVARSSQVDRWLFGTHARGTAQTSGRVTAELLKTESSDDFVVFLIELRGTTVSKTRGVNGPVTAHCVTTIPFTAHCRMTFDGETFRCGATSFAGSATQCVKSLACRPGLFRRAILRTARQRAADQKAAAEEVALRQTKELVVAEFGKCVRDHAANLNGRVQKLDLAGWVMQRKNQPPQESQRDESADEIALLSAPLAAQHQAE